MANVKRGQSDRNGALDAFRVELHELAIELVQLYMVWINHHDDSMLLRRLVLQCAVKGVPGRSHDGLARILRGIKFGWIAKQDGSSHGIFGSRQ